MNCNLSDSSVWEPFYDTYGSHGYVAHDEGYALVVFFDVDVFHVNAGIGWSWKVYLDERCPDVETLVPDRSPDVHSEKWFEEAHMAMESLQQWLECRQSTTDER